MLFAKKHSLAKNDEIKFLIRPKIAFRRSARECFLLKSILSQKNDETPIIEKSPNIITREDFFLKRSSLVALLESE